MIDLDALEALEKKATPAYLIPTEWIEADQELRNALPELIRLARLGLKAERDAKRHDPMSQYLNEGDGVYRP